MNKITKNPATINICSESEKDFGLLFQKTISKD